MKKENLERIQLEKLAVSDKPKVLNLLTAAFVEYLFHSIKEF